MKSSGVDELEFCVSLQCLVLIAGCLKQQLLILLDDCRHYSNLPYRPVRTRFNVLSIGAYWWLTHTCSVLSFMLAVKMCISTVCRCRCHGNT